MEILEPLPRDKKGRVVNPEDAEARAAAKARRQERDAANRAAAADRKANAAPARPGGRGPALQGQGGTARQGRPGPWSRRLPPSAPPVRKSAPGATGPAPRWKRP